MDIMGKEKIEIFCCYAREDQELLLELKKHLMPLQREELITLWADIDIGAGMEWEKEIDRHLNTAQIILLLISPDFIASDYCYGTEMRRAIQRHERGEAHVIPIILRPVFWQDAPFSKFQALPTNAVPITSKKWRRQDDAFYDIVKGIRDIVKGLGTKMAYPVTQVPDSYASAIYLMKIVNSFGANLLGQVILLEKMAVWLASEGNATYIIDSVTIGWSRLVFYSSGGKSGAVHPDADYVFPLTDGGQEQTYALIPALALNPKDRREVFFTLALAHPDTQTASAEISIVLHYHASSGLQGKLPLHIPSREGALLARLLKTDVEILDSITTPKGTIRGKDINSEKCETNGLLVYQSLAYYYSKFLEYCYLADDGQDPEANPTLSPERLALNKALEEQELLASFLDLLRAGDDLAYDICTGFPDTACEHALLQVGIEGKKKVSLLEKNSSQKRIFRHASYGYQEENKEIEVARRIINLTTIALSIRHILWPSNSLANFILMSPQNIADRWNRGLDLVTMAFGALVSRREKGWVQALIMLIVIDV